MSSKFSGGPYRWRAIEDNDEVVRKLGFLGSTKQSLLSAGYVVDHLTDEQLWKKNRCKNCHTRLKGFKPSRKTTSAQNQGSSNPHKPHQCVFHSAKFSYGKWPCCRGKPNAEGCCSKAKHEPASTTDLRSYWTFHASPVKQTNQQENEPSPSYPGFGCYRAAGRYGMHMQSNARVPPGTRPLPKSEIRRAVALDCEMGTSADGESELIRITLIDLFDPSTPLIDALVKPDVQMKHLNTKYSGVTFPMLNEAVRSGLCIFGRDAARANVFEYIDSETFVIVHGGSSDFSCLRWVHPPQRIIDTFVLERDHDPTRKALIAQPTTEQSEQPIKLGMSLKEIADRKCNLIIQAPKKDNNQKIVTGHDSYEDALAARELVAWWLGGLYG